MSYELYHPAVAVAGTGRKHLYGMGIEWNVIDACIQPTNLQVYPKLVVVVDVDSESVGSTCKYENRDR